MLENSFQQEINSNIMSLLDPFASSVMLRLNFVCEIGLSLKFIYFYVLPIHTVESFFFLVGLVIHKLLKLIELILTGAEAV